MKITQKELKARLERFRAAADADFPCWDTAIIVSKVNQYYFTGTMQDALLIIRRAGGASYYVRRSLERALDESPFAEPGGLAVKGMTSYRDIVKAEGAELGNTLIEAETITLSVMERLNKYFNMQISGSLDDTARKIRAVKSPYELYWTEQAAREHHLLFTQDIPEMLKEGVSEAELLGDISRAMYRRGHQGITRFFRFQTEIAPGQIGFSENSLYPSSFDGPGGSKGNSPAVPLAASTERRLKKGDIVFIDLGFGINGYHSDKTQVYMFGAVPGAELAGAHKLCMEVERRTASMLKPGAVPSEIYAAIKNSMTEADKSGFMGVAGHEVQFLGHGVGLHIDEYPVIAKGFDEPLEENMVISLEPKKAVLGAGMVGVEETYLITVDGARCLTGGSQEIITV